MYNVEEYTKNPRYAFATATDSQGELVSKRPVKQAVCAELPELEREEWIPCASSGQVYFVGDQVVKVPTGERAPRLEPFHRETKSLARLKDVNLVPNLHYVGRDHHFIVMEKLPGIELADAAYRINTEEDYGMSKYEMTKICAELSDAIHDIHNALKAHKDDYSTDSTDIVNAQIVNELQSTLPKHRKMLGQKYYKICQRLVSAYNDFVQNSSPVIAIADFHDGNILVNGKFSPKLTGVIDFESLQSTLFPEEFAAFEPELQETFNREYARGKRTYKCEYNLIALRRAPHIIKRVLLENLDKKVLDRYETATPNL